MHVSDDAVTSRPFVGIAGMVRVVIRQAGQGKDFSCPRADYDTAHAFCAVLLHRFRELSFDDVLDKHVDGQGRVETRARFDILSAEHHNLPLLPVRLRYSPTTSSLEPAVQ